MRRVHAIRIQDFVQMAKTAEQQPHGLAQGLDRILTLELVRVAERAAVAAARLRGRGDEMAADQAAVDAMRQELNRLPIAGTVVIGEGERDEAPMLYIGEEVGTNASRLVQRLMMMDRHATIGVASGLLPIP